MCKIYIIGYFFICFASNLLGPIGENNGSFEEIRVQGHFQSRNYMLQTSKRLVVSVARALLGDGSYDSHFLMEVSEIDRSYIENAQVDEIDHSTIAKAKKILLELYDFKYLAIGITREDGLGGLAWKGVVLEPRFVDGGRVDSRAEGILV